MTQQTPKTTREQLLCMCDILAYDKMPQDALQLFDKYSGLIGKPLTDDYVMGTQDFAILLVTMFASLGRVDVIPRITTHASAVLYHWYKKQLSCTDEFQETELPI